MSRLLIGDSACFVGLRRGHRLGWSAESTRLLLSTPSQSRGKGFFTLNRLASTVFLRITCC